MAGPEANGKNRPASPTSPLNQGERDPRRRHPGTRQPGRGPHPRTRSPNAEFTRRAPEKSAEALSEQEEKQRELNNLLLEAAEEGDAPRIAELLKEGAEIDARDTRKGKKGMTALMHACWKGHMFAAEYLISKGADITLHSDNGMNAGLWALASKEKANKYVILRLVRSRLKKVRGTDSLFF